MKQVLQKLKIITNNIYKLPCGCLVILEYDSVSAHYTRYFLNNKHNHGENWLVPTHYVQTCKVAKYFYYETSY